MKKLRNIFAIALACVSLSAQAQEKGIPAGLTKDQQYKLMQWQKEMDSKINAGFAGNEKLKSEMQGELKNIASIKDEKAMYAAAAEYQKKYSEAYAGILKKSGVDLSMSIKELQAIIPYMKFTARSYSIVGTLRQTGGGTGTNPPEGPKTKKITDFSTHKEKSCGLGAGGDVTFTSSSVSVYAVAAVAGGCNNDGDMTANISIPAVNSAKLKVKYKGKVDGFAAAIGGTSITYTHAGSNVGSTSIFYLSGFYAATLLWVGFGEEEIDETQTLTMGTNRTETLKFYNGVNAVAGVSETHGGSKTSGIDVSLTTE